LARLGVSHLGFGVSDIERSKAFYRDLIGLEIICETSFDGAEELTRRKGAPARQAVYFLLGDGPGAPVLVIGSVDADDRTEAIMLDQLGIHHLAIWVDDVPDIVSRLRAAGADILWGPSHLPTYVVDSNNAEPGTPADVESLVVRDPDGICIQIDQRTKGNPFGYPTIAAAAGAGASAART
jgi:catechol 2,3-dioxygenase-like lactoylglutathione lyase family enzyme